MTVSYFMAQGFIFLFSNFRELFNMSDVPLVMASLSAKYCVFQSFKINT